MHTGLDSSIVSQSSSTGRDFIDDLMMGSPKCKPADEQQIESVLDAGPCGCRPHPTFCKALLESWFAKGSS